MQITTVSDIITKKVLNEETGELESKDFKETKTSKRIRGGFRMVYKSYDKAVEEIITSKKDFSILVYIRDLFTYQRVENVLSKKDLALLFNVSEQKITTLIKKMININLLKRIDRGIYRLNPYMYIPFRANAEALQKEWTELDELIKTNK